MQIVCTKVFSFERGLDVILSDLRNKAILDKLAIILRWSLDAFRKLLPKGAWPRAGHLLPAAWY